MFGPNSSTIQLTLYSSLFLRFLKNRIICVIKQRFRHKTNDWKTQKNILIVRLQIVFNSQTKG